MKDTAQTVIGYIVGGKRDSALFWGKRDSGYMK